MTFLRVCLLLFVAIQPAALSAVPYTVAREPWPEWLGSQRAVISVASAAEAVRIQLPWRRHDPRPEAHRFILINAATGDTVANIQRILVDREVCDIAAGPISRSGQYFLYYVPYEVLPGWGYYSRDYLPQEGRSFAGLACPSRRRFRSAPHRASHRARP